MAASHEGKPLHVIYQVEDITERKQAVERLAHQALHDSLTGLANRALLLDRLQHALSRVGRGSGLVAVMFLDLDRFKVINDSLGHKEGDRVLAAVGERLMKILRPSDTVGRFGGDEFVVICESVESEHRAFQIARRLNDSIGEPIPLPSGDVRLTASVGVALSREPSASPEALIRNADAAMYRAKERGRARYEVYDAAMQERAIRRLQVENDLRTAIDSGQLRLFYQPQVRLSDSRIVGVEALVRWEHPQRGLLNPEEFIGVAEEAGLISGLGKWVLEAACRDLGGPRPPGTNLTVAFNVSAAELTRPNYVDQVEEALARTNTLPERLHLEITETLLVDANHYTLGALQALHAMGIQLVIDDFGTGYASLAYLRRFPVDVLKIDRSFVGGLKPGSEDRAIVDAVVKLAHCLNLECVAEGVETISQLDQLRELGCDLAQGYHFGRPVPIDILTEMLT
jgi:diguanylate cyclase (GGDEF)-like protein